MKESYNAHDVKAIEKITQQNMPRAEMIAMMKNNFRPYQDLMLGYQCAMMEIETKLQVLDKEFSLDHDRNPIESIKTRLKSADGIVAKAERKGFEPNVSTIEANLFDIAGVRVICSFVQDIYMLCDCLLSQDDINLVEMRDYIKNPKQNGYRSLHLIVEVPVFLHSEKRMTKVEIQLRTIAMDFWASLEHKVRYKKDIPKKLEEEIANDLKSCANQSAQLDMQMEQIKDKIFKRK